MSNLEINDSKINELENHALFNFTTVKITRPKNIKKIFNGLYEFDSVEKMFLDLHQYQHIPLVFNSLYKFKKLKELCVNSSIPIVIDGLEKLSNLKRLELGYNIGEIRGLENLVNLQELNLCSNKITEIKGLENLIKLKKLNLRQNQIKEIKGLENLVNLQVLNLNYNQITEIKGLDNLVNLKKLGFSNNKLTEIKGLDKLTKLSELDLDNNKITQMTGLETLLNLQHLSLYCNKISELPLSLCNFRTISDFRSFGNPIEHIPLPVQRWLDRLNRRVTANNMVYQDKQNIHNTHIQKSFSVSLGNILRDKQLLDLSIVKQQIIENKVLTEQTKRELLNYCDDNTEHSTYLITYADLLVCVWARIIGSPYVDTICQVLNQEIADGLCMCFTGKLTRLLNTLVGFYDDIQLQISDSEQITNIIVSLKHKITDDELLKVTVKKELEERKYSQEIISEWLEYI